jgi:hypothetical protein
LFAGFISKVLQIAINSALTRIYIVLFRASCWLNGAPTHISASEKKPIKVYYFFKRFEQEVKWG